MPKFDMVTGELISSKTPVTEVYSKVSVTAGHVTVTVEQGDSNAASIKLDEGVDVDALQNDAATLQP